MASTNKTENIGLNLWTSADAPKREDFVNDNKKIDSAVTEIQSTALRCGCTTYVGGGRKRQSVNLDFKPIWIFLTCENLNEVEIENGQKIIYGYHGMIDNLPSYLELENKSLTLHSDDTHKLTELNYKYTVFYLGTLK